MTADGASPVPRMKFGIFMAPFHNAGENPTLALQRDLELIEHLDRLGFDEAWIGEHHSAGWEIIADPAVFIAAAAERTRHIRLGTGVVSLPYHHPLMVADRMLMLDHLTRGRAMLGVGPGALTSDAYMMGIEPTTQRPRMEEALTAILALLRGETVNMETDWFVLREARLQLAPYTLPHLPVAAAASFSPAGPMAAGHHGIGLLSIASHQPGGMNVLQRTWAWVEQAAAERGRPPPGREEWRVVMPFYLAESREEAMADVRESHLLYSKTYFEETLGRPAGPEEGLLERTIERGGAIIGTPDDAIQAVERLQEMSGGFGGLLGLAHEWAPTDKLHESFELWARYVAPRFQGQTRAKENRDWVAENRSTIFAENQQAIQKAFTDAGIEVPQPGPGQGRRPGDL
jgi:limonene 1,2-monooxygenase